jgi:ABC-2 type transport system ATP-binding protein
MNALVNITSLRKSFGTQSVLKDLDWAIQPGSIVGLLGRNGAGKSTLLECMLGLRDRDAGAITLFNENNSELSADNKARIGYVPQTSDLFEWLTAAQMLAYFRALYPRWNEAKVQDLMQRWELPFDKIISKFSVGQKQRLSIIRALAHEPELLVLDEPVSSLDPAGRRDFLRELVDSVIDKQTTIIFSTHILSDLERIAMDVAFLQGGRIVHQQALDDMIDNTVRITGSAADIAQLKPQKTLQTIHARDGSSKLLAQFSLTQLNQLQSQNQLRVEKMGLEDLFIEMTQ